jgi:hypothetical protein
MLANEVMQVINNADKIGNNVFNFFVKFKPYELLLVEKKKPLTADGNSLLDRDTLIEYINDPTKPQYNKKNLVPIYDDIKARMDWKEVSAIWQTTQTMIDCERYDLTNAKLESENCVSFVDRTNGERLYMASDQVLNIMTYEYKEKCKMVNPETGEVEEVLINQGNDSRGTEKHRTALWYRD